MDRYGTTLRREFDRRASERRSLGIAAGDRAAGVLAARTQWEQWGRTGPVGNRVTRPRTARQRLGAWLVAVAARLQGQRREARLGNARGGGAVTR